MMSGHEQVGRTSAPGAGKGFCARTASALAGAIPVLALLCFSFVLFGSMASTSQLDPAHYLSERIVFIKDNLLLNLAVLLAVLAALAAARRLLRGILSSADPRYAAAALLFFVVLFGCVYVIAVKPEVCADARFVVHAGEDFAEGEYRSLKSWDEYYRRYFSTYPFQLGLAQYFELLARILGPGHYRAYAMVNVFFLALGYAALLRITACVFHDRRILLVSIGLLALFLQPIFYCALLYGPIPSFALALWGMDFILRYIKRGRGLWCALLGALLIGLASTIKINALIYAIAAAILLLLDALGEKRIRSVLIAVLVICAAVILPKGAVSLAEARGGMQLPDSGAPALNWLLIGLSESERAPGWYAEQPYDYSEEKRAESEKTMRIDLQKRLERFRTDPGYARTFFFQKIMSQWDEPTFQSIWVSRIKKLGETVGFPASAIYESSVDGGLFQYFRYQVQTLYAFFALGLAELLAAKRYRAAELPSRLRTAALPLVLLGAFLYHALAEAKSQYVLLYLPLLLPYAAIGILGATEFLNRAIRRLRGGRPARKNSHSRCD